MYKKLSVAADAGELPPIRLSVGVKIFDLIGYFSRKIKKLPKRVKNQKLKIKKGFFLVPSFLRKKKLGNSAAALELLTTLFPIGPKISDFGV